MMSLKMLVLEMYEICVGHLLSIPILPLTKSSKKLPSCQIASILSQTRRSNLGCKCQILIFTLKLVTVEASKYRILFESCLVKFSCVFG